MSDANEPVEIRAGVELPAIREEIELHTADGLTLVGELATPVDRPPVATLVTPAPAADRGRLHGLAHHPQGGRAAARARRPRGAAVQHPRHHLAARHERGLVRRGVDERADVAAAMAFVASAALPHPWLVGLVVRHRARAEVRARARHRRRDPAVAAAASHERRRSSPRWNGARARRSSRSSPSTTTTCGPPRRPSASPVLPRLRRIDVAGGKHLWVGETQTQRVLDEIVAAVNPAALPLPTMWPATSDSRDRLTAASALVLARDHDLLDDEQDRLRRPGSRRARRGCRAARRPRVRR